jgi:trehalose/maltose hydrolase-like predicted phosphorylase
MLAFFFDVMSASMNPDQAEQEQSSPCVFHSVNLPGAVDRGWALTEEGFPLAREHEVESVFTLSNGYAGTRGSAAEGTSLSAPATFFAGVFETGDASPNSLELIRLPDWTSVQILVEGQALSLETGENLEHRRILDLRHGLFLRTWRHQDPTGRITSLESVRLVSLHDRHLFLQSIAITPENYTGTITIECPTEQPLGRTLWHLKPEDNAIRTEGTTTRGVTIALAHRSEVRSKRGGIVTGMTHVHDHGLTERWTWSAQLGEAATFTRVAAVYSSRDTSQPAALAVRHVELAHDTGLQVHIAQHANAWETQWREGGIELVGDEPAQRALRFAVYHLTSAVNPNDEHTSVGARALTGSAYKGHIFWDTEIFLLPFYIFTYPSAARTLLMYRFHTLQAARNRAKSLGYQGALYAWESADTGEDVTPAFAVAPDGRMVQILSGLQEHHISADIASAVWQYWRATADEPFLLTAGTDILVETARFWASRVRLEPDGHYHIRTVIGPDEYHEAVDDNAYTNVMAQWNLERAAEVVEWIRTRRPDTWESIARRLQFTPDEPDSWLRVARGMATGFDHGTNLFEQFSGFFQLEEIDLEAYRARTVPIDVILGRERTQHSKVIKQADVVALSAVLWDRFPATVHEANFQYYEPRTVHGSSLSPAMHALVGARLDHRDLALCYFREAAAIDLSDHMGNAAGGVHIASLGGLWQAAVFGMGGVKFVGDGLTIDPHLPATWDELSFTLHWRGRTVKIGITRRPAEVAVQLQTGAPMTVAVGEGMAKTIESRHRYVARSSGPARTTWQESGRLL